MFDFSTPCDAEDSVCNWVLRQTDNETAAWFANQLIGTPLALLGLLLLGLVIRWVLHRLVDRRGCRGCRSAR